MWVLKHPKQHGYVHAINSRGKVEFVEEQWLAMKIEDRGWVEEIASLCRSRVVKLVKKKPAQHKSDAPPDEHGS